MSPEIQPGSAPEQAGKWACFHCGHDAALHGDLVGCPFCLCAGNRAEAGTDPTGKYDDLRIRGPQEPPLHEWQANPVPTEETLREALRDAVRASIAADQKVREAESALDAFLQQQREG